MNTEYNAEAAEDTVQPAAPKPKRITKRAALAATLLVSGGLALVGMGLGSGIAQAQPIPAPQHFWHYCEWNHDWYFFDWDFDHYCHYDFSDYHDYDHHDDHHDDHH